MNNIIFTDASCDVYNQLIISIIKILNPKSVTVIGYKEFKSFFENELDTPVTFIDMEILEDPIEMEFTNYPFSINDLDDFNRTSAYPLDESFIRLGAKYSDVELIKIIKFKYFIFFNKLVKLNNIDSMVSFSVPHFPPVIALHLIMKINSNVSIFFFPSGLGNISYALTSYEEFLTEQLIAEAEILRITCQNIIDSKLKASSSPNTLTPKYMDNLDSQMFKRYFIYIFNRLNLLIRRNEDLFNFVISVIAKRTHLGGKRYLKSLKKIEKNYLPKKKFVYVPLHMQPEASTLPMGNRFTRPELLLTYILNVVPSNYIIVVKENPKQSYRSRSMELKKILENPRIHVIARTYDTYKIIKDSSAVFTLTGTVALEASLFKKRAFVLGNSIYKFLPNYAYVSDIKYLLENGDLNYPLTRDSFKDYIDVICKSGINSKTLSSPYGPVDFEDIKHTSEAIIEILRNIHKSLI